MADNLTQRRWGWLCLLIPICVSVIVAGHVDVGFKLVDLFQEGEYLATNANVVSPAGGQYPLMTHGLIDYLPFAAALDVCGNKAIACTRSINDFLAALSMIAFVFAVYRLLSRAQHLRLPAALSLCAFLLFYNGHAIEPTDLHQGAPGIRDLFLLIDILLITTLLRDTNSKAWQLAVAACLGLTLPIALFWAYNRGLACGLAFGLAVLFLLVQRRSNLAITCVLGALVGVILASAINLPLLEQHLFNVLYWLRNSNIWALPLSARRVLLMAPSVIATLSICIFTLWRGFRLFKADRGSEAGLLVVLVAIAALVLTQSIGRSDNIHLSFVLPYLGILLAACTIGRAHMGEPHLPTASARSFVIIAGIATVLELYSPHGSLVRDQLKGLQVNLGYARHGLPTDVELFSEDAVAVAATLRQSGEQCTYSFDNSEAMYLLSGIPSCSNVLAPVYATPVEQSSILARLNLTAPKIILFSSEHWWNSIDGKSLEQRTPELRDWVGRNYPYKLVEGDYELRARAPFPGR